MTLAVLLAGCADAAPAGRSPQPSLDAVLETIVAHDGLSAAVIVVENSTGTVTGSAVSGAPDAAPLAGGARPLGSVAKTAVLIEALRQGIGPESTLTVPPCVWPLGEPVCTQVPGEITLTDALLDSHNVAFAALAERVGPDHVADSVRRFGLELTPTSAIGWGRDPVAMESVAALFVAIANDGEALDLRDATGGVLVAAAGSYVSPTTAAQARRLLAAVVSRGTGALAGGDGAPYGKTGTAFGGTDAWFAGVADDVTIVAWVGASDGVSAVKPPQFNLWLSGGTQPARIFHAVADIRLSP